jgi:hypothetical protein
MNTSELAQEAGVSRVTVIRLANQLDGKNLGGRRGWVFPRSAIKRVSTLLLERAKAALRKRRTTIAKKEESK